MIDPMTVNSAKARSDVTRSARLIHWPAWEPWCTTTASKYRSGSTQGGRRHDHRQWLFTAVRLATWGRTPSLAFFVGQAPRHHIRWSWRDPSV